MTYVVKHLRQGTTSTVTISEDEQGHIRGLEVLFTDRGQLCREGDESCSYLMVCNTLVDVTDSSLSSVGIYQNSDTVRALEQDFTYRQVSCGTGLGYRQYRPS